MAISKILLGGVAEDAITGDILGASAYLANTATQNISGTYSENRLYTSDAYTLSANTTVNGHLTLSSIKPTADVVLTSGGAYTLTGSGVLSAGSLLAKERSDLTEMTGELGSTVTGSPNLNLTTGTLASGVTFPAGHVIKTTTRATKLQTHVTGGTYTASDTKHNITTTSGNYVLVTAACPINLYAGSAAIDSAAMEMQIWYSTDNSSFAFMQMVGDATNKRHGGSSHNYTGNLPGGWNHQEHQTMTFLHGPVSGTTHFYKVYIKYTGHTGSGQAAILNPDSNVWGGMTLMEIQA